MIHFCICWKLIDPFIRQSNLLYEIYKISLDFFIKVRNRSWTELKILFWKSSPSLYITKLLQNNQLADMIKGEIHMTGASTNPKKLTLKKTGIKRLIVLKLFWNCYSSNQILLQKYALQNNQIICMIRGEINYKYLFYELPCNNQNFMARLLSQMHL